ncbi:MAG TPA: type II toxin-antitoxin system prevent-host-death family antitoxin [Planctomycetota bacterium]|nr:type II toxin-antitoxin system prevent-host-death family antitoxin [Planctomycetota bacterium]
MKVKRRTMKAAEFKAKCLRVLDEVAKTGEIVVITKRGKAVAQIGPVPADDAPTRESLRKAVLFLGDVESPIDEPWDAELGKFP